MGDFLDKANKSQSFRIALRLFSVAIFLLAFPIPSSSATLWPKRFGECAQNLHDARKFSPLPRREVALVPQESPKAGILLSFSEQLRGLADDLYVYLIDIEGRVYFSPRTLFDAKDGKPLATHRSLLAAMRERFGVEPQIVAGGEFEISSSRVSELNNKCGTFRPDANRLAFAKDTLTRKGLAIESGTEIKDAARKEIASAHFAEAQEVEAMLRIAADPILTKLHRRLKRILETANREFPSSVPSRFDSKRVLEERADIYLEPRYTEAHGFTQQILFTTAQDPRERNGRFLQMIDLFGYEKTSIELDWLERLLNRDP